MGGITIRHSHQQKKTPQHPQQNSEVGNLSKLYGLFGYVVTSCGEVDVQTWSSFCFKSIYIRGVAVIDERYSETSFLTLMSIMSTFGGDMDKMDMPFCFLVCCFCCLFYVDSL